MYIMKCVCIQIYKKLYNLLPLQLCAHSPIPQGTQCQVKVQDKGTARHSLAPGEAADGRVFP